MGTPWEDEGLFEEFIPLPHGMFVTTAHVFGWLPVRIFQVNVAIHVRLGHPVEALVIVWVPIKPGLLASVSQHYLLEG